MQRLRQITNILTENQLNYIGSFEINDHMSYVLDSEFYLGIVEVVEVAERSRVVDRKIQGFATRCHNMSRMPNSNSSRHASLLVDRVASSCRSFNLRRRLSHFPASDHKCISVDLHKPAATFGLALLVLDSMLRCFSFFQGLQGQ